MEAVSRALRATAGALAALALTSCSVLFPADFAADLADNGLMPGLVGLVDTQDALKVTQSVAPMAVVRLGNRVVAVSQVAAAAYDAGTLAETGRKAFSSALVTSASYTEFWSGLWNGAPTSGTGGTVWVYRNSTGEVYSFTVGSSVSGYTVTAVNISTKVPVGRHGGATFEAKVNDLTNDLTLVRNGVDGVLQHTPNTYAIQYLQTYDKGVFIVENAGVGLPDGQGGYEVTIDTLQFADWNTASSLTPRIYTAHLGEGLTDGSSITSYGRLFKATRAAGVVYLVAYFGFKDGSQHFSVEAFDDSTGKSLYRTLPTNIDTYAAGAGAVFTLGPRNSGPGATLAPLRKYVW